MNDGKGNDRRELLRRITFAGAGLALAGAGSSLHAEEEENEEVAPAEDLMREHGVLNRILLIYEECRRRLSSVRSNLASLSPAVLADAAGIIRRFIEDYHEKLEEDHLFPRFEKAHRDLALVKVLRDQHRAGRRLTEETLHLAGGKLSGAADRDRLDAALRKFVVMYRPHEAREDTVLFPAIRRIVSPHEYDALGEEFEKKERALFGQDGFESIVEKVAGIEKSLGIYELAQFTP
jgi:hemerythrin-like domain-containing protein